MISDIVTKRLIEEAKRVLQNSYAPYSDVHIAAAILTDSGRIYTGVNVENSSYGLTICAERSAISAMITAGEKRPIAIAIVTDLEEPITPCGACRQVLSEFNPDMELVLYSVKTDRLTQLKLSEIFPRPFKLR
ncbi:MAG: cytidine deaminase [Desulfurococcaceae archaeon]